MTAAHFIEILDFAEVPLSRRQAMQIFSGISRRVDLSYKVSTNLAHRVHRIDPALYAGSPEERAIAMADAVGMTPAEWKTKPIIPWLPILDRGLAVALLAEVNKRRGYSWPIARPAPTTPEEQAAWDNVKTGEDAVDLLLLYCQHAQLDQEPELQEPAPAFAPPAEACKHPCWSCPDILEDPNACQNLPGPCHWRNAWRTASPDKTHEENRDQTKQEDQT